VITIDYANYMTATGLDIAKFQADLTNPTRTLMGYTQRDWLLGKLKQSKQHGMFWAANFND
jgi:alkaline phosphatase D